MNGENAICNGMRQCKFQQGLDLLETRGFDFIHTYPMIECDDNPEKGNPVMFTDDKTARYECMKTIIDYIVARDHADNKTSDFVCLYCAEIFNLKNSKGETLVDQLTRRNQEIPHSGAVRIITLIRKYGAKTSSELAQM